MSREPRAEYNSGAWPSDKSEDVYIYRQGKFSDCVLVHSPVVLYSRGLVPITGTVNRKGDALKSHYFTRYSHGLLYASLVLSPANAVDVAGVRVEFVDYSGPAKLSVQATGKHKLRITSIHKLSESC